MKGDDFRPNYFGFATLFAQVARSDITIPKGGGGGYVFK